MFQYSISLEWSDEDGGYIARIPEFPNLSAFGSTPEEALTEAKSAAEMMLEVLKEDGEQPPEPKKAVTYSGQIRLRLPKTLHRDLAVEAGKEGVSFNTLVVSGLSEFMGRKKQKSEVQHVSTCTTFSKPPQPCFVTVTEEDQPQPSELSPWTVNCAWGGTNVSWISARSDSGLLHDLTPWPKQDRSTIDPDEEKRG